MQPIGTYRQDTPLTVEQYRQVDLAVRNSARKAIVARRLTQLFGPLGFGKQSVTYDKLTEVSDAAVAFTFKPDKEEDEIALGRTVNKMVFIHRSFRIPAQVLEASRVTGSPVDVISAQSAAYKVAVKEDEIILDGFAADGSNYDVSGFYQAAGNTEGTGKDFGTPGNAIDKVKLALGVLGADNIFPAFNMVLNTTQYNELFDVLASTATLEIDLVRRIIQGELLQASAQTAATGMLMSQGARGHFDIAIGVDVTTEMEQLGLDEGRDMFGVVYESLAPRIWETNAICTLTSI